MKLFERIFPIATAIIIIWLVVYFSPTDLTGRYNGKNAMATLDLNDDQELSLEEIKQLPALIKGMDTDLNGELSESEYAKHKDLFSLLDQNEDNVLGAQEIFVCVKTITEKDQNQDGVVSLKELK